MLTPNLQPGTAAAITVEATGECYREEAVLIQRLTEMLRSVGREPEDLLFAGHSTSPGGSQPVRRTTYAHHLLEWSTLVKYPDCTNWTVLDYAEDAAENAGDGPVLISVYDAACLVEMQPSCYTHRDQALPVDAALVALFDVSEWIL